MNAKRVHAIDGTRYDKWDAHLRLQIAIVEVLAKTEKPLSKIEITEKLGKHPVNTPVGGLTRLLEKQGLVIRTRDGRRLLYSLTQVGLEAASDNTLIGKPPRGRTIVGETETWRDTEAVGEPLQDSTFVKKAIGDRAQAPTAIEVKDKSVQPQQGEPVKSRVEYTDPIPEWLLKFPEGGIRNLFAHLATHGVLTESEAANMLGGHREFRRFARQFDDLHPNAPFRVRIETMSGVKRYVRE